MAICLKQFKGRRKRARCGIQLHPLLHLLLGSPRTQHIDAFPRASSSSAFTRGLDYTSQRVSTSFNEMMASE